MRSTPAKDAALRLRLQEAVDKFDDGNTDAFGRRIGYMNGGYIREALSAPPKKPVREALIDRVHAQAEMRGWFDAVLAADPLAGVRAADAGTSPSPRDRGEAHLESLYVHTVPSAPVKLKDLDLNTLPDLFVLELEGEAMSPDYPPGTFGVFRKGDNAIPGKPVLVVDRDGHAYVRRHVERTPKHWTASAANPAFEPLDSIRDGLIIQAVMIGHYWASPPVSQTVA